MIVDKQVAGLKALIFYAEGLSPLAKQILVFLLDQSKGLTKGVRLTLVEGEEYTAQEIHENATTVGTLHGVHSSVHFDAVMAAVGTDFRSSVHYGRFDEAGEFDTTEQFEGLGGDAEHPRHTPVCYTFWLAPGFYSRTATAVSIPRAELEAIDITKPGSVS